MKFLKIIKIMLILCAVNIGVAQEVEYKKKTYFVSGTSVFNAGKNVTETLSDVDKKSIFTQLRTNEKLIKRNEKAIAKAKKEAKATEKKLRQSEKALKKEQKLIKAKEKAQSQLKRYQTDLAKEKRNLID